MIRLALTKGRIEKTALEYLAKAGYDVSELDEDKKGRKLLFKVGDDIEVVLAKAADVITYVEHGVCDGGDEQEIKGSARVADGTQDAGTHIKDHGTDDARKPDYKICACLGNNLGGHIKYQDKERDEADSENCECHAKHCGQENRCTDGAADIFPVIRAKKLRDHNARTARQTDEKADHQICDMCEGADRGKRLLTYKLSDDPSVDHVI